MGSAAAMTDCQLLRTEKKAMMGALHREHALSDMFVAYLLGRNIRYEEDLVDQLFRQGRRARDRGSEDQSGDFGRDGRHHPFPSELFHEPIRGIGTSFTMPAG